MYAKAAARRWHHPTPAWLIYGAAVATGVLFAAERWRWFPEHYQKGWPVLLAVAVVAAVLIVLPAWMLVGLVFRRRVQFGLRTMLVFVTLCAVVCSWLTVRLREARRQAEAVAAILQKFHEESAVWYDWVTDHDLRVFVETPPPGPEPLRKLLGVDFLADVTGLTLDNLQLTEAEVADLAALTPLKGLWLNSVHVTDEGLSHLERLTNLQHLILVNTQVTNEGVKKLQHALPQCKIEIWESRD